MSMQSIICIQLGAREHYSVPRALETAGAEVTLLTDLWTANPGGALLRRLGRGGDRFHPGLSGTVISWNRAALAWELLARLGRKWGWRQTEARNRWFAKKIRAYLESEHGVDCSAVFAYSYCALDALRWSREHRIPGLLDQIDPGPALERVISKLDRNCEAPSESYWRDWNAETAAASIIVVNSDWSRRCLVEEGIDLRKIAVVPLAYESNAARCARTYPDAFSAARPLRVLFLGRIVALKGIDALLGAMERFAVAEVPVALELVGSGDSRLLARAATLPNCRLRGHCSRADAGRYYSEADVFILPTFSDGFALTQLEAQAAGLPVIASRHCGDVVRDGVNGLLLDRVDECAIHDSIMRLVRQPGSLAAMAARSGVDKRFSLASVGEAWMRLISRQT